MLADWMKLSKNYMNESESVEDRARRFQELLRLEDRLQEQGIIPMVPEGKEDLRMRLY